jgi:tetratricopeptide (TPR) repeat protein
VAERLRSLTLKAAEEHAKEGAFEEARDHFLAALDLGEADWTTHLLLSRVYRKLKAFEQERDQISKALAMKKDDWYLNLLLSRAHTKLGDDAAALAAVRRASQLGPDQADVAERLQRLTRSAANDRRSSLGRWKARLARLVPLDGGTRSW